MKVIFAQGNPGDQYAVTRHNVGWQVLDTLAAKHGATFSDKPKFFARIAEYQEGNEKVLLVKPATYYNETGKSARSLIDFYKLDPMTELLVLHDELALPLGTLRIRDKGSDAGNNGIKSLNAHLGESYHRLRIGVSNDLRDRIDDADFVLSRFTKNEQEALKGTIVPKAIEIVEDFIISNHQLTSHTLENI
jgi:PTH1 family peptidyl-tRNA hydrolase